MSQNIDAGKILPIKGVDYWTPADVAEMTAAKTAATSAASSATSAATAANAAAAKVDANIATNTQRVTDGLSDLSQKKAACDAAATNAQQKATTADAAATNATAAAAVANKATLEMTTQAGSDHDRAEADHTTAAGDHTTAGGDHTRANSDHTRMEADHTTATNQRAEETATFNQSQTSRQSTFEASETARTQTFNTNETARTAAVNAEIARVEEAAGQSAVNSHSRDFGMYAALPDVTLTLVAEKKRINSKGEFVADEQWNVGKLGKVVLGNTYELLMQSEDKMVIGTALFVSHTTETIGTTTREVYTPLFSAKDTKLPIEGYAVFEAYDDYEEVLVCYRRDVANANVMLVRRYGSKASSATQNKNLRELVERKTDMEGKYPSLSAGTADNLTPRGDASDEVIATRIAGGTNSIEDGNATIKTIKGKTIKWGQSVKNWNFADRSNWTGDFSVANNEISVNVAANAWGGTSQDISVVNGHKYLFSIDAKVVSGNRIALIYGNMIQMSTSSSSYVNLKSIVSCNVSSTRISLQASSNIGDACVFAFRNCVLIDLTACGLDSCTTPDQVAAVWGYSTWDAFASSPEFADLMAYSETPRLISSKPKAIKTCGRNLWDEQWELGTINTTSGLPISSSVQIRNKNFIDVLPSTAYCVKFSSAQSSGNFIYFYDADGKFISHYAVVSVGYKVVTTPSNCAKLKFVNVAKTYGNDICVNVSDPTFNGQYEPYESHNRDLSWVGDIFPDGVRGVNGVYDEAQARKAVQRFAEIDLGDCDWSANCMVSESVKQFITTNLAIAVSNNLVFSDNTHIQGVATSGNKLRINSDIVGDGAAFKAAMSGVKLVYELATPIETEYEEKNLTYDVINGGMEVFEAEGESAPLNASVVYGIDSYNTIKRNKSNIGVLANLATASKADLVAAINELVQRVSALETSAATEGGTE